MFKLVHTELLHMLNTTRKVFHQAIINYYMIIIKYYLAEQCNSKGTGNIQLYLKISTWYYLQFLFCIRFEYEVKFSIARSLPWWIICYYRMWGQLSTTSSNATEVAQWGALSYSRPLPATDNGVRDGRSNWMAVTPHPTEGSTPWAPRHLLPQPPLHSFGIYTRTV